MEYLVVIGEDEFTVDQKYNFSAGWEGSKLFKEKYNLPNPIKDIEPFAVAIAMPKKRTTESVLKLLRAMQAERKGEKVGIPV